MTLPGSYGSQFGLKAESSVGTAIAVDRFHLIETGESLKDITQDLMYRGLGGGSGLMQRQDSFRRVIIGAGGDVPMVVTAKSMGVILKQILGTVSGPTQVASTTEYTQSHTPDTISARVGLTATLQVGRAQTDGTITPFTYAGGKCQKAVFSCKENDYLRLVTSWLTKKPVISGGGAAGLQSASYATSNRPFDWTDGAIDLNSVSRVMKNWDLTINWGLDDNRRGLGSSDRREPLPNGELEMTGNLDAEFENSTDYAAFVAGDVVPLTVTFTGDTIPSEANPFKIIFTMPAVIFTGDPPTIANEGILRQPLPYKVLWDGTNPMLTIEYHTTDTAL